MSPANGALPAPEFSRVVNADTVRRAEVSETIEATETERREVRVAGYTLLTALPLAFASALLLGGRSTALLGSVGPAAPVARVSSDMAATYHPPVISITIEPAGLTPVEAEPPVVFPGYLLPDDGPEEQAHAGS